MSGRAERDIDLERLRRDFSYAPAIGVLMRVSSGKPAGWKHSCGYIALNYRGGTYYAHRLIWLYMHGVWPTDNIDHVNRDSADNRLENLRACTQAENLQNLSLVKRKNGNGFLGVTYDKKNAMWAAQIMKNRKHIYLGRHATKELAHAAYLRAKRQLHTFVASDLEGAGAAAAI